MATHTAQIATLAVYYFVLAVLALYGAHRILMVRLYYRHRQDVPHPAGDLSRLPRVTVQLPIYNEVYVVERLIDAAAEIDYPPELLEIQVLDDSTDETSEIAARAVERWKRRGIDIVHVVRSSRDGYKAGALQAGLRSAKGELLAIFDADFVPQPDVLRRTVPFFGEPTVGMVQARWEHLNRDYSLLTKIQSIFLDGHFVIEHTARNRSGRFFNFNGTAGIWRRTAIEEAGGWHADTLTEDLDLSYRAQLKGWRFLFLPDLVIPAELPEEMNGFKTQQKRWTKGSIQTCLKILPKVWRAPVPLLIKLEATAHLTSNFGYLLLVFMCILTLPHALGPKQGMLYSLLVDLPIFLTTTVSIAVFYIVAQRHLNPTGWKRDLLLLPMLLALATGMSINNSLGVLEALFRQSSEFTRTPKSGSAVGTPSVKTARRYNPVRSLLPAIELIFAAYFGYCTWNAFLHHQWMSIPFLLMFLAGFLYVAWNSLRFPSIAWNSTEPDEQESLPA